MRREDHVFHITEKFDTSWKIYDDAGSGQTYHYEVDEFLVYLKEKLTVIIASYKQDGTQDIESWQFILNKNGYMRQYIKEEKMNKGYIEKDDQNKLIFNQFAIDCVNGSYYEVKYDPSNHADMTGCTDKNVIKHFETTQINGQAKAFGETPENLFIELHSKSILGFIENKDDPNNSKNQHFIFGRISDHDDSIIGVIAGQAEHNHGIFYAKRLPNKQSYPIYDHINGATISYPYDTMTSQAKNFNLKKNGIIVDVIMENVDSTFSNTNSKDYTHTIDAMIIVQNESPYEVKLNKINKDGTEETSDLKAESKSIKKIDTTPGQYYLVYYNNSRVGLIKIDLTNDFHLKYKTSTGAKLFVKLFVLRSKIWMVKLEGEETSNSLNKTVY